MALQQSKHATGNKPVVTPSAGVVTDLLFEHVITGNLAANDIIDMGPIEAGIAPVEVSLIADDLDSNGAPTITLTVGILNAAKTDIDAAATSTFIAASNVAQTGGVARNTTANTYLAGAASTTRSLGIKVVAGPATAASAGKKVAIVLGVVG